MTNREKIMQELTYCLNEGKCTKCEYTEGRMFTTCRHIAEEVLAFLEEQPEIVPCKDCEFGKVTGGNIRCHKPGMREYESDYHSFYWFCADGKQRKEDS